MGMFMSEIFPYFGFQGDVKSFHHRSFGIIIRREKNTLFALKISGSVCFYIPFQHPNGGTWIFALKKIDWKAFTISSILFVFKGLPCIFRQNVDESENVTKSLIVLLQSV